MSYPFSFTSTSFDQPHMTTLSAQNNIVEPISIPIQPALDIIVLQNQSFSLTKCKAVASLHADACMTTTAQYPHTIFKMLVEKEIFLTVQEPAECLGKAHSTTMGVNSHHRDNQIDAPPQQLQILNLPSFKKHSLKVCTATSQYCDSEFEELRHSHKRSQSVDAIRQKFRKQNRYKDIPLANEWLFRPNDPQGELSFKRWELELMSWDEEDDLDNDCPYINASRMGDHGGDIIAQAPITDTKVSFWQMVWKANASVIVILTPFLEGPKSKCSKYFPRYPNIKKAFVEDTSTIYVKYHQKLERNGFINWEVVSERYSQRRFISIVQCVDWKDHAVYPADKLVWLVKYVAGLTKGKPFITHCSAGIGRSGTFYACYLIYLFWQQSEGEVTVNVLELVKFLRNFRPGLVQTKEQYELIFAFIKELEGGG